MNSFFLWNQKISNRIKKIFPHTNYNIFKDYNQIIGKYFGLAASDSRKVILDIGGGKSCHFQKEAFRKDAYVVAMDVSAEELALNRHADRKIQADATKELPFPKELEKPCIVCSECVMEHLENNASFVELSAEVIAPGGYFIALMPNKFAPFAVLNQMLGEKFGKKVLSFFGKLKAHNGFKAYYHKTYPSALKRLLKANGYRIVEQKFSSSSSAYFDVCFPVYFLSSLYESIVKLFRAKNLCGYFIIVAQKE